MYYYLWKTMSKHSVIHCPICRKKTVIKSHKVDGEWQRILTMDLSLVCYGPILLYHIHPRKRRKKVMPLEMGLPWPVIKPYQSSKRARTMTITSSSDCSEEREKHLEDLRWQFICFLISIFILGCWIVVLSYRSNNLNYSEIEWDRPLTLHKISVFRYQNWCLSNWYLSW